VREDAGGDGSASYLEVTGAFRITAKSKSNPVASLARAAAIDEGSWDARNSSARSARRAVDSEVAVGPTAMMVSVIAASPRGPRNP
jgi:hypothetical protein